MSKKQMVCRDCGSDDVSVDAYVDWNVETQSWDIIRATYESATCHQCGDSCKLNEVPYADPAQVRVPDEAGNNPT